MKHKKRILLITIITFMVMSVSASASNPGVNYEDRPGYYIEVRGDYTNSKIHGSAYFEKKTGSNPNSATLTAYGTAYNAAGAGFAMYNKSQIFYNQNYLWVEGSKTFEPAVVQYLMASARFTVDSLLNNKVLSCQVQ